MQYHYEIYSFQHPGVADASHDKMAAMAEQGWRIHTAGPNYIELAVLWERDLPARKTDETSTSDDVRGPKAGPLRADGKATADPAKPDGKPAAKDARADKS